MHVTLSQTPHKANFLQGFPSFGLIGTIVTEYLIEHLQAKKIGSVMVHDTMPMVAVHNGQIVEPVSIYYCEKHNLVFMHIISGLRHQEWKFAEVVLQIAKQLEAWEIISIEGVADQNLENETQIFSYTTHSQDKLVHIGVKPLTEGVIIGVAGALVQTMPVEQQFTCFFATSHSELPDAQAAAKVIEVLDKYLHLAVDPEPLLQQAQDFEKKVKGILQSATQATEEKEKKNLSYVG